MPNPVGPTLAGVNPSSQATPVAVLHLWRVAPRRIPWALGRMAWDRVPMRLSDCGFHRLLGTSRAGGFGLRDADPRHWALLSCWRDAAGATAFDRSRTVTGWDRLADERLRLELRPLSSRGRWGGKEPFGRTDGAAADRLLDPRAPVAAITRARIRVGHGRSFRQAVPAVSADLARADGLRLAVGVGEFPVGLQGTVSLWDDAASLAAFAYRGAPHADVVRRTPAERWYAEELFARFAVVTATGSYDGRSFGMTAYEADS